MPRILSGPECGILHKGIHAAFGLSDLTILLNYRLNRNIWNYAPPAADYNFTVFLVVEASNKGAWWPDLLIAARASNPGNVLLIEAEAKLFSEPHNVSLEKVVDLRSAFQNVDEFGRSFGQLVNSVCAVEGPNGGLGTGWLVAPDIVITNFHVIKRALEGTMDSAALRCHFDFKSVGGDNKIGRRVNLAKKWCIASRPYSNADTIGGRSDWQPHELDYALLRLETAVGSEPGGANPEPTAPIRGWIRVDSQPPVMKENDRLWVFQHPQDFSVPGPPRQMPMQLSDGKLLEWVTGGLRLRHDARTLPGSSGAICCNSQLKPVALHHAGDKTDWPEFRGDYNQAIDLKLIVADLVSRLQNKDKDVSLEPFWDKSPF